MRKAVILLSGGLDSSTCLAIAQKDGYELHSLSFRYGQRHEFEIGAAKKIAKSMEKLIGKALGGYCVFRNRRKTECYNLKLKYIMKTILKTKLLN